MKRKTSSGKRLSELFNISVISGTESAIKAQLKAAILQAVERKNITHQHLADKSGIPRSAVTGILSGSMQKVTIDRLFRMIDAVGVSAEIHLKKVS